MTIYILNLILIIIYDKIFKKLKKGKSIYIIVVSIQLFFILALRGFTVGDDLDSYIAYYKIIGQMSLTVNFMELEKGYVLYNSILGHLSPDPRFFFIVTSAILVVGISKFIHDYSKTPWLSYFLFITLGFYAIDFGLLRQALAIIIVINGFKYVENRKFWKFGMSIGNLDARLFEKSTCWHNSIKRKKMERLYKKLESYGQSDYYPFHMPGHKRNRASSADDFLFERDITEISGFDNLHHAEGILKEAQEYAAQIYGTKKCFFSVNGSTAALLAAVSASVNKGGKILVARNCHKAVYHALYLRELQPVYIYPHEDQRLGINGGISPERVERYLEENTDVQAFLLTSPTYDGVVSDIKTIAEVVHRHKIPLIVDEAHGAHLHYSKYFPVSAADLGADIVIQSFHKTLPSMTQTAVLHICSDMADVEKIKRFMGIYQTSSPSYILMASMDACMDKLRKDGQQMFREFTFNLEKARQRLSKCEKIKLIEGSMIEGSGIYDFDRSKLLFSTVGTSVNGHLLHQILRDRYHIEMEMAAEKYVLGIAAVGDTEEGFERLCTAIEEIDAEIQQTDESEESQYHTSHARMTQLMTISQAVDAQQRRYSLKESVGKVSAEFAYLYPPGIPIIVPGEQITGQFVRNVRRYMEQGLEVQGLSDTSAETICVAARNEIGQEEYSPAKE